MTEMPTTMMKLLDYDPKTGRRLSASDNTTALLDEIDQIVSILQRRLPENSYLRNIRRDVMWLRGNL